MAEINITFSRMIKEARKIIIFGQIILIIILGLLVYFNISSGKFIWDDLNLIKNNEYIKQWDKVSIFFFNNIGSGSGRDYNTYRPLQMVTYAVDYSLWGLNEFGYHLTNIVLHIAVALAIFWLINLLFSDRIISWLTSILFIVHPIHTEAVSYISSRADLISALFLLLCIIFYLKHATSNNKYLYVFVLFSYALALLSKESSLILLPLLLLYHYIFEKKLKFSDLLPIAILSLIYLALRATGLKFCPSYMVKATLIQRIPGFFVAILEYIRLLLFPFNLHMDYGKLLFCFNEPKVVFGIAVVSLLLVYAFKKNKTKKLITFSILWFLISILPHSNLYPINAYMAEHWLYLSSIGFFLFLAYMVTLLYRTERLRMVAVMATTFLLCSYAYITIKQNNYWKEEIVFYKRTLKYAPHNSIIHYNLGNAYSEIGINEKAIDEYKKATELNPNFSDAYNNLGNTYIAMGRNKEAIEACKKAVEIDHHSWLAYYNLGEAYVNLGEKEKAIEVYSKAIEINHKYLEAYNNFASLYANTGEIDKGIELWNKLVLINPSFSTAHFNLAVFYYQQGKYDLAIKHCDKVIELGDRVDSNFLELLKPHRK